MRRFSVFLIIAALYATTAAVAADPPPLKLFVANDENYRTDALISAPAGATTTVEVSLELCKVGPSSARIELAPGAADVLRDIGEELCDGPIRLIPAPDNGIVEMVISYENDAIGARSSFVLGAVGAVTAENPSTVGPLISDGYEGAWITVVPQVDNTPLILTIEDLRGRARPVVEHFIAQRAGRPTQYRIAERGIFRATVAIGFDSFYGCWPGECSRFGAVYGFGSTGDPGGGTFRPFPFGR